MLASRIMLHSSFAFSSGCLIRSPSALASGLTSRSRMTLVSLAASHSVITLISATTISLGPLRSFAPIMRNGAFGADCSNRSLRFTQNSCAISAYDSLGHLVLVARNGSLHRSHGALISIHSSPSLDFLFQISSLCMRPHIYAEGSFYRSARLSSYDSLQTFVRVFYCGPFLRSACIS